MRVLIVEDEPLAQEKLVDLLTQFDQSIEVVERLDSVRETRDYLRKNPNLDLLFLDIQLSDGLCFEIFRDLTIDKPVIFTTAFDQYALEAFKLNSIDYLLKPISYTDLEQALVKFKRIRPTGQLLDPQLMEQIVSSLKNKQKKRFLVRVGNSLQFIATEDIAYFQAEDKIVYLVPQQKKERFIIDHTMEELMNLLSSSEFFRVNRSFIIRMDAISGIHTYVNSRLKLELNAPCEKEVIISRERVSEFKNWLNS